MTMTEEQIREKVRSRISVLVSMGSIDAPMVDDALSDIMSLIKQAQYEYGLELIGDDHFKDCSCEECQLRQSLRQRNEGRRGK